MIPGRLNLVCPQGTTFAKTLTLLNTDGTDKDVSDCTAALQVREHYADAEPTAEATVVISTNTIFFEIDETVTANLVPREYVYDLKLTDPISGRVDRLIEGKLIVTPEVTR